MNKQKKTGVTYRALKSMGVHLSPDQYGDISLLKLIIKAARLFKNDVLQKITKSSVILSPSPLSVRVTRPLYQKWRGVDIGKNVSIDEEVIFDGMYPEKIHLADGCILSNGVQILAHKRDYTNYKEGDDVNDLGYIIEDVFIGKGATIGAGAIILSGVKVGDGAVVAAGSVVSKDVEPYTLVGGIPVRKIKDFRSDK